MWYNNKQIKLIKKKDLTSYNVFNRKNQQKFCQIRTLKTIGTSSRYILWLVKLQKKSVEEGIFEYSIAYGIPIQQKHTPWKIPFLAGWNKESFWVIRRIEFLFWGLVFIGRLTMRLHCCLAFHFFTFGTLYTWEGLLSLYLSITNLLGRVCRRYS